MSLNDWGKTVRQQINQLELIATWASLTNQGRVRDLLRNAIYELKQELILERCQNQTANNSKD